MLAKISDILSNSWMSRVAAKIELSSDETDELNRWIKSGKTEQRKVERAKIVLRSAEGKATHQIAKELGTRPTRVSKWRNRFAQLRVPGLEDEPRSGRRVINDESVERRILDQLAKAPPPGFARWNGRLVAEALSVTMLSGGLCASTTYIWIGARVGA